MRMHHHLVHTAVSVSHHQIQLTVKQNAVAPLGIIPATFRIVNKWLASAADSV